MSSPFAAPAGASLHCLLVEADAAPNALLRLLEPFVIHDVLPLRLESRADGDALRLVIAFSAESDLAERLQMRLCAMPVVRGAALDIPAPEAMSAAAA
ncbi:hypothetical protein V5F38_17935 [Xanthobacter sp. V0B-10]|uniref:hypothetical protein n=1 Tax=Xanthobacter albus TaxID=3119929 RepID=UPI0037294167